MATRAACWIGALAVVALGACTLEEITLVEAEDVLVAEVFVQLSPDDPATSRATAWLHRTLDSGAPSSRPVPGASILVTSDRGFSVELAETAESVCVQATPVQGTGTCYATSAELAARFHPGDRLTVEIVPPGGGLLEGTSGVPGDFTMLAPAHRACRIAAGVPLEVTWSGSAGAWAYVNETLIRGLRGALAPRGITVENDPLFLLGLSVSAADTSIVFPGEFGLFDRFELDQGVALALQEGLPEGAGASVAITSADRNYVNWARGGNFNPSGQVRVPSLRGDGTGVFATSVSRSFTVWTPSRSEADGLPGCTAP